MSTQTQLVDGKVVETNTVDFNIYITRKKQEVDMLSRQIEMLNSELKNVLDELSNLIK